MTARSDDARKAVGRPLLVAVAALTVVSLAVWFAWQSGVAVLAWLMSVVLLVLAGLASAGLSATQSRSALGLIGGAPVVAGAAAGSYDDGHTVGIAMFVLGLLTVPAALWWSGHAARRREPSPRTEGTGLQIFGD